MARPRRKGNLDQGATEAPDDLSVTPVLNLARYLPKQYRTAIADLAPWEVSTLQRVAAAHRPMVRSPLPRQDENWYIVITNPNCHRRAQHGLAELGYRAFWPKHRKWVLHARTKVAKEYPILGRYLFVEVPDGNFYAVRSINGVEALLTGDDNAPAKVSEDIVWAFHDRYVSGEWDFVANETGEFMDHETGELRTRKNPIPAGARIRIMEGEFADLLTTVRRRHHGKLEFLARGKFHFTRESNVRAA